MSTADKCVCGGHGCHRCDWIPFREPAPQPPADARQMPEVPCTCITAHDRAVCQGWCKPNPADATVGHGRVVSWEAKFEPTDTVTRGDGAPVCARDGCGLHRDWFVHNPRSKYHHPFVEPAPQPPAEKRPPRLSAAESARRREGEPHPVVLLSGEAPADAANKQRRALDLCTCTHTSSHHCIDPGPACGSCDCPGFTPHPQPLKPAAPPVSGDGDEAAVREIANRHVSAGYCCFTNAMVAVREALERGRALGAREADVGALDAAIDWSKYPKLRAIFEHRPRINVYWLELVKLAADIAGRSGGQGK